MRPPSPSIPEKEFFFAALSQGLRLDGRAPLASRPVEIVFGTDLGYVEVALGKTRVIASVSAEMTRPTPERPYEGVLSIHSELSPMAGVEYESGRPSDDEVALSRMLDKILRRSDALDKESLCVLAGQRVWHVRLTLSALSSSGNLLDCAVLAGLIALRHFRRPEVEVVGDEVIVHPSESRAPLPLAFHHTPLCLTFALFTVPLATGGGGGGAAAGGGKGEGRVVALLDPAGLEATLAQGTFSVALNAQKELCVVHKAGGIPLGPDEVMRLVQVAVSEVKALDARVTKALEDDWARRRASVEVR